MVDNNDSLFREVAEELRREKFQRLWEKWGSYLIALAVVVVLAVAGAKFWQMQRFEAANAAGAEYEAAAELRSEAKTDDALKAFEAIAANGPEGYSELASLSQAGAYLKLGKRKEALAIFDKLAESAADDPSVANFARLQAAALSLDQADFTEMQNRLKPLTEKDSPWQVPAGELLATAALKAGKIDEARTILTPLLANTNRLTEGASERLNRLMAQVATAELSSKGAAPAPTKNETPAPATSSSPQAKGEEKKPEPAP